MKRALSYLTAVFVLLASLQGCSSISYYAQSLTGHFKLISDRQQAKKLVNDPSESPEFRAQMAAAIKIRQFASDELALPDNRSYRSYVDTHREFVTWVVYAAPELSLEAHTWCFPVLGCVPYRGYFSKDAAEKYAASLRDQGLDVYVGGVTAYSTLGWFNDPLLNTMFMHGDTYLASLVFHELAHQRVYVRNDSAFNESFAVAVETSGVAKWLKNRGDRSALTRYKLGQERKRKFLELVSDSRDALTGIYTGAGSDEEKRVAKAAVIKDLRAQYRRIRNNRWNGYSGYDSWFDGPINNAKFVAAGVYSDLVPAFNHLLEVCSSDYGRFYRAVERISTLKKGDREQALGTAEKCG